MDKANRDLFNPALLKQALHCFGFSPSQAESLDGFESFIYHIQDHDKAYILRIGHDSRRSPELIQGEAEFLNHLVDGGLSVPRVVPSIHGRLVEAIETGNGSHFLATLFEKAPGSPPHKEDFQTPLVLSMGRFMGKLHRLSKTFHPSKALYRRFDIETDFTKMEKIGRKHLPAADSSILKAYHNTVSAIRELPKDKDSYGLCHVDFHGGNFFVTKDGKITLFDFDDCQYAWFIYDIAMALFYAISHDCTTEDARLQAHTFLTHFWMGYQTENNLDAEWIEKIPLFLRLREIDLYMIIHRSMDLDNLDRWSASFMNNRRAKILNNEPYCGIEYQKIAKSVIR